MKHCIILLAILSTSAIAQEPVDTIIWSDQTEWNCIKNLYIKPLSISNRFKGKKEAPYYVNLFITILREKMVGQKGFDNVDIYTDQEILPPNSVIIQGSFLKLNSGSKAARLWVGFGAGASWCEVNLRGFTSADNEELFSIFHQRGSALGLKGDELEENVEEVATDIAAALLSSKSMCEQSN